MLLEARIAHAGRVAVGDGHFFGDEGPVDLFDDCQPDTEGKWKGDLCRRRVIGVSSGIQISDLAA